MSASMQLLKVWIRPNSSNGYDFWGLYMNGNDILRIGYKQGKVIRIAPDAAKMYREQKKHLWLTP